MNTLKELREYIAATSPTRPAPNVHANISAYIEAHILPPPHNALFTRRVPPLDIILFALRALLAPPGAPRLDDVPDLLDFATTIEFYRTLAVQKAREALTVHDGVDEEGDGAGLTEAEAKQLREHVRNDGTLRGMYIEMLLQYIQLDIYRLWTHTPPRTADVTLRLGEYFPALNPHCARSLRLFHVDLSAAERAALSACGRECCRFVCDSYEWAAARTNTNIAGSSAETEMDAERAGRALATAFKAPAFAAAFPSPVRVADLRHSMDCYMELVEEMVGELQAMFPQEGEGQEWREKDELMDEE
ncbi:hypothetical protein DFH09DRAFT_1180753 [Mycena vulgaris]|nr:hypothetical protein DFH09DRAFT_1180753 [Mycena vulgaris]